MTTITAPAVAPSRAGTALLWVAQIALAAMFFMAGATKIAAAPPEVVQLFDAIGVGQWFRYATGTIEVVSAFLLLVPSLAVYGALALAATMVGAIIAHAVFGGSPAIPIVLLATASAVAWARRKTLPGIR